MSEQGRRVAVVTGAAGGIGQELVHKLQQDGWFVVATHAPGATGNALAGVDGEPVPMIECDLSNT